MSKIPFDKNDKTTLTPEEIENFKKKYGKVMKVSSDDKKYACFLHTPDRLTLDAADAISTKKDRASMYNETIIKNCWLAGNKEMVTDEAYFFGLSKHIAKLVEVKEATLEEL